MASDEPTLDGLAVEELTLDIRSLTLGEIAACELASGQRIGKLLAGSATLTLLALYVREIRTSPNGKPERSWSDLSNLPGLAVLSSISPSRSDGPSETSSD